jgi:hypothetical protein
MRGVVNLILPVSILIHVFFLAKERNPNIEIRNKLATQINPKLEKFSNPEVDFVCLDFWISII